MSDSANSSRSAVVFGARNLGRAVIDLLVAGGWNVTGVARTDGDARRRHRRGRAAQIGGDITDQDSVVQVLEEAAARQGGVDLVVNAAAAYGGDRSGPFGGGPSPARRPTAFDSWAAAPARSRSPSSPRPARSSSRRESRRR